MNVTNKNVFSSFVCVSPVTKSSLASYWPSSHVLRIHTKPALLNFINFLSIECKNRILWSSGETAHLPLMWPGFNSNSVPYVGWVCCWFSFCPEGFSPGFRFFSLHKKPTSLNRHINQERGPAWKLPKAPDSLSVTFTADGLRQRLSLIFYSFPVINRYRGMSSAILNPNRVLPKGPQPHVQEPFEAKIYTSADTISSKKWALHLNNVILSYYYYYYYSPQIQIFSIRSLSP